MVIQFDLFTLLVSYIFGNVFIAMFGIDLILLITGILGRMAIQSILVVLIFFTAVFLVGYIGALAAVPLFLICVYYFVSGFINWINNMR